MLCPRVPVSWVTGDRRSQTATALITYVHLDGSSPLHGTPAASGKQPSTSVVCKGPGPEPVTGQECLEGDSNLLDAALPSQTARFPRLCPHLAFSRGADRAGSPLSRGRPHKAGSVPGFVPGAIGNNFPEQPTAPFQVPISWGQRSRGWWVFVCLFNSQFHQELVIGKFDGS
jgi:hypothetical protein